MVIIFTHGWFSRTSPGNNDLTKNKTLKNAQKLSQTISHDSESSFCSQETNNGGVFVESPSSFSSPSTNSLCEEKDRLDQLQVSLLGATLENPDGCCYFNPYVILEIDHPAQRKRTSLALNQKSRNQSGRIGFAQKNRIDFVWSSSQFML